MLMVQGEKKVVLTLVSSVNWNMIYYINLTYSLVLSCTLCVADTEMLECWERRVAFLTDGWMFCSVEKEITSSQNVIFCLVLASPGIV